MNFPKKIMTKLIIQNNYLFRIFLPSFFHEKLCLDIFIFYHSVLESDNKKVYKYGVWNKNAYYDYKLLEELSTISFYGREYSTPGKTSEYLEAKYGDDWKIPRENWNVVIDDKSISRQENQS